MVFFMLRALRSDLVKLAGDEEDGLFRRMCFDGGLHHDEATLHVQHTLVVQILVLNTRHTKAHKQHTKVRNEYVQQCSLSKASNMNQGTWPREKHNEKESDSSEVAYSLR